jgi:NAD kinase
MSVMLLTSIFSISLLEKMLLPVFKGDLSTVDYKVIDNSDSEMVIVIDGVTYIYKLNN